MLKHNSVPGNDNEGNCWGVSSCVTLSVYVCLRWAKGIAEVVFSFTMQKGNTWQRMCSCPDWIFFSVCFNLWRQLSSSMYSRSEQMTMLESIEKLSVILAGFGASLNWMQRTKTYSPFLPIVTYVHFLTFLQSWIMPPKLLKWRILLKLPIPPQKEVYSFWNYHSFSYIPYMYIHMVLFTYMS